MIDRENTARPFIEAMKTVMMRTSLISSQKERAIQELVDQLLYSRNQDLQWFQDSLQNRLGLGDKSYQVIYYMAQNCDCREFLGGQLCYCWLKYKLFANLGINNMQTKKQKIRQILNQFRLQKEENIKNILKQCCIRNYDEEDRQVIEQCQEEILGNNDWIWNLIIEPKSVLEFPQTNTDNEKIASIQAFNNLSSDYNQCPENSFFKLLFKQLIHYKFKGQQLVSIQNTQFAQTDLKELQKAYKQQNKCISKQIQKQFSKLLLGKQKPYEQLKSIKQKLLSIDIFELQRLIQKSQKAKNEIKSKEIILFFGNTGAGKTTLILKFLGYTLKPVFTKNNLSTFATVQPLSQDHQCFQASPQMKSCTRNINTAPIPSKMFPKKIAEHHRKLHLADCPGFFDTAGLQVQLTNGLGTMYAINSCKSIRLLVILPKDSISGDRMTGMLKIANAISRLFKNYDEIQKGTHILFNKFQTQAQVKQFPAQIESRLKYLTQSQKKDEKLVAFLDLIHEASKNPKNYVKPLLDNFSDILLKILQLSPISPDSFHYDLDPNIYTKVESFCKGQQAKAKELFDNSKYHLSKFHLGLLQKLKNIINNQKIEEYWNNIRAFIIQKSKMKLNRLQKLLNIILTEGINQSNYQEIVSLKQQLQSINNYFSSFILVQHESVAQSLIQQIAKELMKQVLQPTEDCQLPHKILDEVKKFSKYLKPKLQNMVEQQLTKRFNENEQQIISMLNNQNFSNFSSKYTKMLNLANLLKILQKPEFLKAVLKEKQSAQEILKTKQQAITKLIDNSQIITEETVQKIKEFLQCIKEVEKVNVKQKQFQLTFSGIKKNILNQIKDKCQKILMQMQDLASGLNTSRAKNMAKDIKQKTKSIELLLVIQNIREDVQNSYKKTKNQISKRLDQNMGVLVAALENSRKMETEQYASSLKKIKKAIDIVENCSKILSKEAQGRGLIQSICKQLVQFVNKEKKQIDSLNLKLFKMNSSQISNHKNIKNCLRILTAIKEISQLSEQLTVAVSEIRINFQKKLQLPYQEFCQKILKQGQLLENQDYKTWYNSLQQYINPYQLILEYSTNLQQQFSDKQYFNEIAKQFQDKINDKLEQVYKRLKKDIQSFVNDLQLSENIELSFDKIKQYGYLKDLVSSLVVLNGKAHINIFFKNLFTFDLKNQPNRLRNKLSNIFETIAQQRQGQLIGSMDQKKSQQYKLQLIKICRFLATVERYFSEDNNYNYKQLGFKAIAQTILKQIHQNINDKVKILISLVDNSQDLFPLDYDLLREIFDNKNIPKDVKQKVFQKVMSIQRKCKSQLNKMLEQFDQGNKTVLKKIHTHFKQLAEYLTKIDGIFTEQYKKRVILKTQQLYKSQKSLIQLFEESFYNLMTDINEYNLADVESKSKDLAQLQKQLHKVLNLNNNKERSKFFGTDLGKKKQDLQEKIKNLDVDYNFAKSPSLTKMINDYVHLLRAQVRRKYCSPEKSLELDKDFPQYYKNASKQKEKIQELNQSLKVYFTKQFNKLKQPQISSTEFSNIKKQLEQDFKNLPAQKESEFQAQFQQTQKLIITQYDQNIQKTLQCCYIRQISYQIFFDQALKAFQKSPTLICQRYAIKFQEFYKAKFQKILDSYSQKIDFITEALIKNYQNFKSTIGHQDVNFKLQTTFNNLFGSSIKKISFYISKKLMDFCKLFQFSNRVDMRQQKIIETVSEIYETILFLHQLKSSKLQQSSDYHEYFVTIITETLEQILAHYDKSFNKAMKDKTFDTFEMLNEQKFKRVRSAFENLKQSDLLINKLKVQFAKLSTISGSKSILQDAIKKILQLNTEEEPICILREKVQNQVKLIKDFQFNNSFKKNWTKSSFQSELVHISDTYLLLRKRKDFYDEYIFQQPNHFNIEILNQQLVALYKLLCVKSFQELQNYFTVLNYENNMNNLNIFIEISEVILSKKVAFIQNQLVAISLDEIKKKITSNYQNLIQKCSEILTYCKQAIKISQSQINKLIVQKNTTTKELKKKNQQEKEQKRSKVSSQKREQINNQIDPAKKQQLQKKLKSQLNTIQNEFKQSQTNELKQLDVDYATKEKEYQQNVAKFVKQLCQKLVIFYNCAQVINFQQQKQNDNLELIINQSLPETGRLLINLVSKILSNIEFQTLGKAILNKYTTFIMYAYRQIKQKIVKSNKIQYAIGNIFQLSSNPKKSLGGKKIQMLTQNYTCFIQHYKSWLTSYSEQPDPATIERLVIKCKDIGQENKNSFYFSNNPIGSSLVKALLLARILALIAILKSQKTFNDQVQYLFEPHSVQISTIFLLLGLADKNQSIQNRMIQMKTGEGKSLIIAVLASYLALSGFKVKCACYSAYLSSRDKANYKQLFEYLSIEKKIRYATFNEHCEDILNCGGVNLKQEITKRITDPAYNNQDVLLPIKDYFTTNKQNILIIDEVDVFFQQNFFGKLYCPSMTLRDPTVKKVLQYVWEVVQKDKKSADLQLIIQSECFQELIKKYPNLQSILKNQVRGMVAGALDYNHTYFLGENGIVYKDNDTICYNLNYGYRTVFANVYQHKRGNLSKISYEQALGINLALAQFSYALLPTYFCNILGVTGTLEVMSDFRKQTLKKQYQITELYSIPSAYGINQQRKQSYFIVNDQQFYDKIAQRIEIASKRPVIVFFKDAVQMSKFHQSQPNKKYLDRIFTLTQQNNGIDRDGRIQKSTYRNKITFMTGVFGRGIDFKIFDQSIINDGGLHIIQTYLSLDESEQVQIKGRTARQYNPGSYDCIINQLSLELLGLKRSDFPQQFSSRQIYYKLCEGREKKSQELQKDIEAQLQQSKKKHEIVLANYGKPSTKQQLTQYIYSINKFPQISKTIGNVRTIVGIDATGSMTVAIRQVCSILGQTFERAQKVVNKANQSGGFEMKIIVYRNYNSPAEKLLEHSSFESDPKNLKTFLSQIRATIGLGNEALEVFLQAANKQEKVDQIILVGDAPANTNSRVQEYRKRYNGQQYWNKHGFIKTTMEEQLKITQQKNIPIHTLPLASEKSIRAYSDMTRGVCKPLKINQQNTVGQLTDFFVENILKIMGSKSGQIDCSQKLVDLYRKMYS